MATTITVCTAAALVISGSIPLVVELFSDDKEGNQKSILSRVGTVALAIFVGSLCFAGAVLIDALTSLPQAVALGVMGFGGLIYLLGGACHLYSKRPGSLLVVGNDADPAQYSDPSGANKESQKIEE